MYQNIERFQETLIEKKIDLAILRLPQNVLLFSQYWPRNALSFCVIPARGVPSVIYPIAEQEDIISAGLTNTYSFRDLRISDGDPFEQITEIFTELARKHITPGRRATIGVENDYDQFAPCYISGKIYVPGVSTYAAIDQAFGNPQYVGVRELITDIMAIKTEFDLKKLQTANRIAHLAMDKFEELIEQPGIREIDVASEVENFVHKTARGFNGSRASRAIAQLSSGLKSVDAVCEGVYSDERVLKKGDVCLLELGLVVDGYWSDVTRTGCVGGFRGEKARYMDIVNKAFDAGLSIIRPGVKASAVHQMTQDVIEKEGLSEYYDAASGHGVGFAYHEDRPILHPESQHVLKKNMVIALEPALYVPGVGGFRTELNIMVDEDGGFILGQDSK